MDQKEELARRTGQAIRDLRRERGLSQARLARQADVSDQTVYRAERGLSIPEWDSLVRIAEVLGAKLQAPFGGDSDSRAYLDAIAAAAVPGAEHLRPFAPAGRQVA